MNYCSLEDAFQEGAPSPGCGGDQATKQARREERRKARRCKGPAATYLDLDPDRQNIPLPEVNAMNHVTGLREHVPVTAPQEEGFASELIHVQPASVPASSKKRFFGADPDDGFADYEPDQRDSPSDFMAAFQPSGVAGPLPSPSMQQEWKPLTASGAQTAFIEHLPPPGGQYAPSAPRVPRALRGGELSMEDIMKKMDRIMARLDDTHTASPEQVMSEMMMFISSGIFVLFLMDLLVKKGSTLRF
jgi:hypothetical protein